MKDSKLERDYEGEGRGWIFLVLCMFGFPILFFLCVWFPIWIGIAGRY